MYKEGRKQKLGLSGFLLLCFFFLTRQNLCWRFSLHDQNGGCCNCPWQLSPGGQEELCPLSLWPQASTVSSLCSFYSSALGFVLLRKVIFCFQVRCCNPKNCQNNEKCWVWKVRRCFTVMKPHFHSEMDIRCDFDSFIHEPAFLQHWWERQLRCREWVWRNRNGRRGLNSDKVCDTLCWQGVLRGRSHQWPHQVPTSNGARYGCVCVCVCVCMCVSVHVMWCDETGVILSVDWHHTVCWQTSFCMFRMCWQTYCMFTCIILCVDKHTVFWHSTVCWQISYCVLTNVLHTGCWQTLCCMLTNVICMLTVWYYL